MVRRIITLTESLSHFPLAGRKVPEFDDEAIRELLAYSYRIIYLVEPEQVTVAAVVRQAKVIVLAASFSGSHSHSNALNSFGQLS